MSTSKRLNGLKERGAENTISPLFLTSEKLKDYFDLPESLVPELVRDALFSPSSSLVLFPPALLPVLVLLPAVDFLVVEVPESAERFSSLD